MVVVPIGTVVFVPFVVLVAFVVGTFCITVVVWFCVVITVVPITT